MLEFEKLVYLDVQKTGSRFVVEFLRTFAAGREIGMRMHKPVSRRQPDKLYVISMRDPLESYCSLYRYGCSGGGRFRELVEQAGYGKLYDKSLEGFSRWLALVTGPVEEHESLFPKELRPAMKFVGLQTARYLSLALPDSFATFRAVRSREQLTDEHKTSALPDMFLRQETLNEDLLSLTQGSHRRLFKNTNDVPRYLAVKKKINSSVKLNFTAADAPQDDIERIRKREWLLYEALKECRTPFRP